MGDSTAQLLLGLPGPILRDEDAAFIRNLQPGGFVLREANLVEAAQVRRLTDDLRAICDFEPFLCIDAEADHLWSACFTGIFPPTVDQLRSRNDRKLLMTHGWITGRLLRLLGCNFNLAPTLDLGHWGTDDQAVIDNAGTFNRYQRKQGVLGCGKQFPAGPHETGVPSDQGVDELLRSPLLPYTALMPELDGIMVSHARLPKLDADRPASLSPRIITRLLRDQLGFNRLVLTNRLSEEPISDHYPIAQAARLAVEAGADLLTIDADPAAIAEVLRALDGLPGYTLADAIDRIEKAKKRLYKPTKFTPESLAKIESDLADLRRRVGDNTKP